MTKQYKDEYVILKKGNTADISFTTMLKKKIKFVLASRYTHSTSKGVYQRIYIGFYKRTKHMSS
jgi:hypothetical protein